ncbi:MAG TPA: DUF5118 domain-containing protein, partial [Planctomycetaceae bacterium]|nr:DUF5118 domain-containing protein [Planctomycetaceae bacterium]
MSGNRRWDRVCRLAWAAGMSVVLMGVPALTWGQAPKKEETPKKKVAPAAKSPGQKSSKSRSSVKPYDEVITKEAKTQVGLFRVHRIKDQIYYELPPSQIGKDMLWVTQLDATQAGYSYGGMPVTDRVVRWELRGEKVLLRDVKYLIRTSKKGAIEYAVEHTNMLPIIKVFAVKAWGKDKAPVIDVTSLFTSDVKEFSAARMV